MFMKQNGNKFIMVIFLIFTLFYLSSCSLDNITMTGDWTYDKLPNNYEVWRINSASIVIGKRVRETGLDRKIERYVFEFCYNDVYVGAKRLPIDDGIQFGSEILQMDKSNVEYYLINTETDIIYGPHVEAGYEEQCKELNVGEMCEWIKTTTKPEGAKY